MTSTSYIGFTLTDGALRLIVLLYADDLGFDAIDIAIMFSFYEVRLSRKGMCIPQQRRERSPRHM